MKKKLKRQLLIIYVLITIASILSVVLYFQSNEKEQKIDTGVIDNIDGYDYEVTKNDSKLFQETFIELKNNLNSEDRNVENTAQLVAELFIIDLFTLSTKVNKYDIGGSEFYHSEMRDMYELKVIETFYNNLEDNTYGKREQELPEVEIIIVTSLEIDEYQLGDETVESYVINVNWKYLESSDYDTSGKVIIVNNNDVYEVVEFTSFKNE